MDSVFDTKYSHAHSLADDTGNEVVIHGQPASQPASQPGPKSKCEMVWIDHRETVTISVAARSLGSKFGADVFPGQLRTASKVSSH